MEPVLEFPCPFIKASYYYHVKQAIKVFLYQLDEFQSLLLGHGHAHENTYQYQSVLVSVSIEGH